MQTGVFTRDLKLANQAYESLDGAAVLINQVPTFRAENMPYGGIKLSAAYFVQELPIVAYDPPLALPVPDFAMYWHSRSQEDAGHKWLRGKIAALLKP